MSIAGVVFTVAALTAVLSALVVVRSGDPFRSVLSLILAFGSLGVVYLTLDSPFVAVAQLVVYATAVVVMFLFVIAYLGDRREVVGEFEKASWTGIAGVLLGIGFIVAVGWAAWDDRAGLGGFAPRSELADSFGTTAGIAEAFLTDYILHFEVTSLVLLAAAIGGIVLGLTGRERHAKMRRMMRSSSADMHRKRVRESAERMAAANGESAAPTSSPEART